MDRKKIAIKTVSRVGKFLKSEFVKSTTHVVHKKTDGSLVSEVDKMAEEVLVKAILANFPEDGILSEECGEVKGKNDYRWIIDPLDGTHNFLAGLPIFGCLLAIEKKGEVIFSVCYFPVLDEFLVAEKGQGATLNGAKISVSNSNKLDGEIVVVDGKIRQNAKVLNNLREFSEVGSRIRVFGSGPFSMARVALGQVVAATSQFMKPWDILPVALLVDEAGGKVTDFSGNRLSASSEMVIATNGFTHVEALKLLSN